MLLAWIVLFAVLALVSGFLGFTRLSAAAATVAKLLFFIFLIAAVLFLIQWAISGFPTQFG